MTDFAPLLVADRAQAARALHLVDRASFADWIKARPPADRRLAEAQRFNGKSGVLLLPAGEEFEAVVAVKDRAALSPWCLAAAAARLPEGTYRLAGGSPGVAALGWLLAQHRFDRFRSKVEEPEAGPRVLLSSEPARIEEAIRLAGATALVRDLVNTPAADLGPAELERAVRDLGEEAGAQVTVTSGRELAAG